MRVPELDEPANLLLAGICLPPERSSEQGDQLLPQVSEVQARQPIRARNAVAGAGRCERAALGVGLQFLMMI